MNSTCWQWFVVGNRCLLMFVSLRGVTCMTGCWSTWLILWIQCWFCTRQCETPNFIISQEVASHLYGSHLQTTSNQVMLYDFFLQGLPLIKNPPLLHPGIPFYTGSGFDTIAEVGGLATSSAPRKKSWFLDVFGWLVGDCCGQTIGWLMFVWLVGFSYVRTYFTKNMMHTIFEFWIFSLDFFCIEGDVEWKGCRFGGWVFFAMIRNRS